MNITERKRLRQRIRNVLGVSRDEAPSTEDLLRAAHDLETLFNGTSGYRMNVEIINRQTAERVSALEMLHREIRARQERADARRSA